MPPASSRQGTATLTVGEEAAAAAAASPKPALSVAVQDGEIQYWKCPVSSVWFRIAISGRSSDDWTLCSRDSWLHVDSGALLGVGIGVQPS